MQIPIDQVESWIHSKHCPTFLVSKEENGDLDQVQMNIQGITLKGAERVDPDGYVAAQALLLHGQGSFVNGGELPQNVYEIPLLGTWITQDKGNRMQIETQRAVYTIQTQTTH
ncbi:MAG TPA: hypothetical protein VJ824_15505 [Bacillota bacterium]|nr:hypothetical protein [Bacillota bacterium]